MGYTQLLNHLNYFSRKISCRQPQDWGWSSSIGNPSTALAVDVGQGSCKVPVELQSLAEQNHLVFPCRGSLLSAPSRQAQKCAAGALCLLQSRFGAAQPPPTLLLLTCGGKMDCC